ncbi:MAG: leucine-rich repeat domain-containing protein [Ruminococcus sp.]|nr:leucine-rich repeat domain-containing protein [Ruminococcus sp.]
MIKKYVTAALAVLLVFGASAAALPASEKNAGGVLTASAEDWPTPSWDIPKYQSGDYEYTLLDDGTAEIVKYTGSEKDVTIPSELDGFKVTSIKGALIYRSAFSSNPYIINVTIPDSVKCIGYRAFKESRILESIIIPNSVTSIGTDAFSECKSLESITIPDSVTSIEKFAFAYSGLKNIILTNGITKIEDGTFEGCAFKEIVIPNNVTSIGESAFNDCKNLESLVIPNNVTSIEGIAFYECTNLKNVTIPKSVKEIKERSFGYCFDYDNDTPGQVDGFTIYCYKGTAAEQYAIDNGFDYVLLDEEEPVSLTDTATGVKVEAEAGVVPEDAKLIVEPITSGEGYDKAAKALGEVKAFRLFEIHLENAQGEEIKPDGNVTVSIPIPEEFGADLAVYRINDDDTATKMEGSAKDGVFTYLSDSFSNYALAEAKQNEGENNSDTGSSNNTEANTDTNETKPGTTDSQGDTTTNPQTGAAATGAGVLLAAAIAIAAKKRNK